MSSLLRLALEAAPAGVAVREVEHVFYGRLEDFKQLEKAARREFQEQWEIKVPKTDANGGSGKVRVRKSQVPGSQPKFDLTTKVKMTKAGDRNSNIEVTLETTADNFLQFQVLAESGMKKVRYFFPVEATGLVWEIDLFVKDVLLTPEECLDGGTTIFEDWCKIDLEVKDKAVEVPAMPIEFAQLITAPEGQRTAEEEAQVRKLYDTAFLAQNRYK